MAVTFGLPGIGPAIGPIIGLSNSWLPGGLAGMMMSAGQSGESGAADADAGVPGEPGFWEGLIPVWGSGRSAWANFRAGNWGWGIFHTAMAIADVFLVKALVTGVGKLLVKGGMKVLGRQVMSRMPGWAGRGTQAIGRAVGAGGRAVGAAGRAIGTAGRVVGRGFGKGGPWRNFRAWRLRQGRTLVSGRARITEGFAAIGGRPSGNFTRSRLLLDEVKSMAESPAFVARARALGFADEVIETLPQRLNQYAGRVGECAFGGWADSQQFLIGRYGLLSTRGQRIMHELGHVLDDLANPGLFARSAQSGFGFRGFYGAERVAYTTMYGFNPVPLTAFNAVASAHPIATRLVVGGALVAELGYFGYRWKQL